MAKAKKVDELRQHAQVESLIARAKSITLEWAKRNDLWYDSWLKDPLRHYEDEPSQGEPLLLLCSDGDAGRSVYHDDEHAQELRDELEEIGLYLEQDDAVTSCFHLIDPDSELQTATDRYFQWRWMCSLIEADTADVNGDLYQYFADNPEDLRRLSPRQFEELISSVFAARGWRTEIGPGSGDQGVDLRIWQSDPLGEILTLVQAKRYAPNRPIGLEAVAALETHVEREGASRGLFVTTSRYLPGVKTFAGLRGHRLQLADSADIQRWCEESAYEATREKNRALSLDEFPQLIAEIKQSRVHPKLLVGSRSGGFCILLKQSKNAALLVHIPSQVVSGNIMRGHRIPLLNGQMLDSTFESPVFVARRKPRESGGTYYWGQRTIWEVWDGEPILDEIWD